MAGNNGLAPLLTAAAGRYRDHDGAIARQLAQSLSQLVGRPIVAQPAQVGPCALLPALLASRGDPLLAQVAAVADLLHWRLPGRGRIPQDLASRMAAVEIVGPSGMIEHDDCRFGLFIQSAGVFYPEHCHEAEELYLTLSGTAQWGTDRTPLRPVAPGSFIRHEPWQAHVMETLAEPLLALWGWTGNLDFSTYTMGRKPADLAASRSPSA